MYSIDYMNCKNEYFLPLPVFENRQLFSAYTKALLGQKKEIIYGPHLDLIQIKLS